MSKLTEEQAYAVWDVLVTHAGARKGGRDNFVHVLTDEGCDEYRFQGALGFGGKFWPDRYTGWRVTAYPEDERRDPKIWAAVETTNAALRVLQLREAA